MSILISFTNKGMPPRKDGGTSMWSKNKEVNKLLELRANINAALQKLNINTPISDYMKLKVEINLPEKWLKKSDIDNLIGGICDGLQRTSYSAKINKAYEDYIGTPLHPTFAFIENDSLITEVFAKKIVNEESTFYTVNIELISIEDLRK